MAKLNNTINPDSRRLKYSEWRPIGVCDTADPGLQKAQMFTREDFVIITAPDVNRDNWHQKPQVKAVIMKYIRKLEKMSTLTKNMKKPVAKDIKLVGAIMKLAVTPNLNQESRDGKLQFFRVIFEDEHIKNSNKKKTGKFNPWMTVISTLILVLMILLGAIVYKLLDKKTSYREFSFTPRNAIINHCTRNGDPENYLNELDEIWDILKEKNNEGLRSGMIKSTKKCYLKNASISSKEEQIIQCYKIDRNTVGFSDLPFTEQRKISTCFQNLCNRPPANKPAGCY